jgi:two-component system, OmpR family, response regulator
MTETPDKEDMVFRILVVDDNRDAADSLATLVRLWGYDVQVAYNGPDALQIARDYRPHCILSDIGLPGIDGYRLAAMIRAEESLQETALIAISAYSDLERAKDAGFDHCLIKPADLILLERLVKEVHIMGKRLGRLDEAVQQQGAVVHEVKELMKEVKTNVSEIKHGLQADVQELKKGLAEVKEDVKGMKEELREVKENKDTK